MERQRIFRHGFLSQSSNVNVTRDRILPKHPHHCPLHARGLNDAAEGASCGLLLQHELHKLVVVDFAITVLIRFPDHIFHLVIRKLLPD